ncbi:hypothetical protein [Rothia sp. P5766]|uniref:hypothetical protein n=1 Tax=Rothia sp. P5766 TaxID=3402656 RepID=UPI003AEAE98B
MKKALIIQIVAALFLFTGILIILNTFSGTASTVHPAGYILFGTGVIILMVAGASAHYDEKNKKLPGTSPRAHGIS